jgi:hypothetical protein
MKHALIDIAIVSLEDLGSLLRRRALEGDHQMIRIFLQKIVQVISRARSLIDKIIGVNDKKIVSMIGDRFGIAKGFGSSRAEIDKCIVKDLSRNLLLGKKVLDQLGCLIGRSRIGNGLSINQRRNILKRFLNDMRFVFNNHS